MSGFAGARRLLPAGSRAILRQSLALSPRMRKRLLALALIVTALAGGYLFWFRDSSLVAVRDVSVTGATGRDAGRIASALAAAARDGTTLHVARDQIEREAAAFPTVRAVEIEPDFPHALTVRVIEHRAAAFLTAGDKRVPVAADGSVLAGLPVEGRLPTIAVDGAIPARRLPPGLARDAARVAGAAPQPLAGRLESIGRERRRGIVVRVVDGPELIFGTPTRLGAKWAAAARVLADRYAAGADYVDLRIPERPAAGGLQVGTVTPVAPAAPAPATAVDTAGAGAGGQTPTPAPAEQAPATGPATGQAAPTPATAPQGTAPPVQPPEGARGGGVNAPSAGGP